MAATGSSIAKGTGMTAAVMALGTALQMVGYYFTGESVNDEQSDALAILLYPFVAWAWSKVGYDPGNGTTTTSHSTTVVETASTAPPPVPPTP